MNGSSADRSRLARAAVRRLVRRRSRAPDVLRWAALASIWVHLGGLVGLALVRPEIPQASSFAPALLQVVLADPSETPPGPADDLGEDAGRSGQDAAIGAGATPSGAAPPRALAPRAHEAPEATAAEAVPATPRRALASEAPELEPAPSVEDEDEAWLEFVRTEEVDAVAEAPETELISAHTTRSVLPRRAPVTSERVGPLEPLSDGPDDDGGRRTLERRTGEPDTRLGNRAEPVSEPVATGGGGGGHQGRAFGAGASGAAGTRLEGGAAAAASAGGSAGAAVARSIRMAPHGTRSPSEAVGWWKPMAVRVVRPSPPAAVLAAAPAPAVTRGEVRAVVERPGARTDVGGTKRERAEEASPEPPADRVGLHRVAPPGTADPIAQLREALGFGPIDRDRLAPRPAWAGTGDGTGRTDSSPQAVVDEVPIDWQTSLSTVGTPLGAWVQQAEELIVQRWHGSDLEPHERAIGLQGQVTVRYLVGPSGRVSEVRVARSSGNLALDRMAVAAIPGRLPRLPRELEDRPLHHQITLRYRNPLVTTAADR